MAEFDTAHELVQHLEGGWNKVPEDRGGETFRGIARKFWPDWPGWKVIDLMRSRRDFPACANTSRELAHLAGEFYRAEFWDRLRLNGVRHQEVANEIYEQAVNVGQKTAAMWVQKIVGATVDGRIGPQTLAAINARASDDAGALKLIKSLNRRQRQHYDDLIARHPEQAKFRGGWYARSQE